MGLFHYVFAHKDKNYFSDNDKLWQKKKLGARFFIKRTVQNH